MLLAGVSHAGYVVLLSFSTSLALVPYLFSAVYALMSAIKGTGYEINKKGRRTETVFSIIAVLFVVFMIYGAGLKYLLLAAIVWAVGLPFFIVGKKERHSKYTIYEFLSLVAIILMTILGIVSLVTGFIKF